MNDQLTGNRAVRDIVICGVGGQGTVLASRLLAGAYLERGLFVRTAETIGMAQRGGCVVSHVRVESETKSPLIPAGSADLLIGFEPAETARTLGRLRETGSAVSNTRAVLPVTASLGGAPYEKEKVLTALRERNTFLLDAEELAVQAGSSRAVNLVLLGASAGAGMIDLTSGELVKAMKALLPPRLHEVNERALALGMERGRQWRLS